MQTKLCNMCADQCDGRVSPSDVAVYGRRTANVVQRRFGCLLSFCRTTTVVGRRTSHGDDSVVCCRSAVPLRPSCGEHRTETIRLSAAVLTYRYGRRAANIARRRLCCAVVLAYGSVRHAAHVVQRQLCAMPTFSRSSVQLPLSRPSFFATGLSFR